MPFSIPAAVGFIALCGIAVLNGVVMASEIKRRSSEGSDALVRGGRYDEVGAVFGRTRPAVGFSLDVKALAECARPWPLRAGPPRHVCRVWR